LAKKAKGFAAFLIALAGSGERRRAFDVSAQKLG